MRCFSRGTNVQRLDIIWKNMCIVIFHVALMLRDVLFAIFFGKAFFLTDKHIHSGIVSFHMTDNIMRHG